MISCGLGDIAGRYGMSNGYSREFKDIAGRYVRDKYSRELREIDYHRGSE